MKNEPGRTDKGASRAPEEMMAGLAAARSALSEGKGAEYLATGSEVPKGRWVSEDFLQRVDGWCSLVYHRHRNQLGDETAAEELRKLSSDARLLLHGMGGAEDTGRAE